MDIPNSLSNIKAFMNIQDGTKDYLITTLLNKIYLSVLSYCNIDSTNMFIDDFIENKVINILKISNKVSNTFNPDQDNNIVTSDNEIKSISRGDTKIEYNVASKKSSESSSGGSSEDEYLQAILLTKEDKLFLNRFRKLRWS